MYNLQNSFILSAPGKVSAFKVTPSPGGNYTIMEVSWKAPALLDRNSILSTYVLETDAVSFNMFMFSFLFLCVRHVKEVLMYDISFISYSILKISIV